MTSIKLPDLCVRSVLDVVKENFQRVDLKTYAVRMIYCGEHTLTPKEITKHFRKSVDFVNLNHCDVHVCGCLLAYDSYFVHIIEGCEDTINRQLRFLFNIEKHWIVKTIKAEKEAAEAALAAYAAAVAEAEAEGDEIPPPPVIEEIDENKTMFRRLKMLMVYHSITTRIFSTWHAIAARPPSLVAKYDLYAPIEEHMEQLTICLEKISKFCKLFREDENLTFEGLSANDPKMEVLPEVVLLDYLLNSPYLLELREAYHLHRRVDDNLYYFEVVWPLPAQYTPRHLYKLKIDESFVEPLPVMWWEKQEEAEHDEDKEDQGSSSSD